MWNKHSRMPLTRHNQKQKPTVRVGLCFWWKSACINRAENKTEFIELMQLVKLYKEKWL